MNCPLEIVIHRKSNQRLDLLSDRKKKFYHDLGSGFLQTHQDYFWVLYKNTDTRPLAFGNSETRLTQHTQFNELLAKHCSEKDELIIYLERPSMPDRIDHAIKTGQVLRAYALIERFKEMRLGK